MKWQAGIWGFNTILFTLNALVRYETNVTVSTLFGVLAAVSAFFAFSMKE
jgi:urea transporter